MTDPIKFPDALAAGVALGEAKKSPLPDGVPYTVIPEGYKLELITAQPARPVRAIGTVKMRDAASFIAYYNRSKRSCSQIYASLNPAKILGIIDDHSAQADHEPNEIMRNVANWRQFRVEFAVPPSREWSTWTGADRKPVSQIDFATFIEDNLPDIVTPSGSDMLAIALNFEASKGGNFVSSARLDNGSTEFVWKEDVEAKGNKLAMPTTLAISIPVFENGAKYDLTARLKYRISSGQLSIWYELVRAHKVLEEAFRAVWAEIEDKTSTTLLLGSPE